jgi:hypothetical protein
MGTANLALAFGIGLPYFIHPAHGIQLDMVDAFCGFLMGFSICMNFSLIRNARRRDTVAIPKR